MGKVNKDQDQGFRRLSKYFHGEMIHGQFQVKLSKPSGRNPSPQQIINHVAKVGWPELTENHRLLDFRSSPLLRNTVIILLHVLTSQHQYNVLRHTATQHDTTRCPTDEGGAEGAGGPGRQRPHRGPPGPCAVSVAAS